MANYLLAYTGGTEPQSEEEGKAVMDAWVAWFTSLGAAVVDPGNPTGPAATVASDGSVAEGGTSGISGYSVVSADSLEAATAIAQGCPHLAAAGAIEVYETFDVM
ncbi:MAG: hypothetical protein IPO93_12735 [Actinobacteria bacterium]|jgi:hypothetical protein|nr:hypothetical protein [Actinomycetota bacterium]